MKSRIERLREELNDNEAALVSSYPNIFYYSGFTSEDAYLLISHDKQILITDSRYTIQAYEQAKGFEVVDISKGFEEIFKQIDAKYIGYEEDTITVKQYRDFKRKITDKQELAEIQKKLTKLRKVKDEDEIRRIAEAEKIGDEAFEFVLNKIRPGVTEKEIALELEYFMKRHGATTLSFDTIAASGKRSAMPHGTASDKIIEKGDFLTLDFGCVFEGYCSDMTRTVAVGEVDGKQREIYETVLKAQEKALDIMCVGVECSTVDEAARKIIKEAGYGANFGHGLGHSVGIEIHEMPSLSPKCNEKLKNGHVITVEPGIYIEGFGGVRIEDLVVVTDDGIRNLTNSPKELIIL